MQNELLQRSKSDPMLNWKPHRKQKPFIDALLNGKTKMAGFFAANRSGKSQAGAYVGSHLARYGPPNPNSIFNGSGKNSIEVRDRATAGWVVCLDSKISRGTIQPKYFDNGFVPPGSANEPFIPKREIATNGWHKQDQVLKLKNGSLIEFMSCESDVEKFQGSGKDWIHFDEQPPKPHYEESTLRVEAGRRLIIFMTCTLLPPQGEIGGVTWAYNDIILPWKAGELPDWEVFTSSIYDNPHLDPKEIARMESQWAPGTPIRRIRLDGELLPGISGMRAYSNFARELHVRELGEPDPRRPLCWCWDFNVAPMVTEIGQKAGDMFRVFDEIYLEEGSIADMVDMFMERYYHWDNQILIYGDATGENRSNQTNLTNYTAMFNAMRVHNLFARKKVPLKNPPQIDRLNAVNAALMDAEKVRHIEVDPRCEHLIADFEQVLLNPDGTIKKSRKPTDSYYSRTHSSDAAGYLIAYERPLKSHKIDDNDRQDRLRDPSYGFGRKR
jgi:phage terminase large subunit-like protein